MRAKADLKIAFYNAHAQMRAFYQAEKETDVEGVLNGFLSV